MANARSDEAASEIVESVGFSFYTAEEVRRISVKRITNPDCLDAKNVAVADGLYDPAMGPINDSDSCKTCGQLSFRCQGHCGHIELARPVYNPLLFRSLQIFLQVTCNFCHKFTMSATKLQRFVKQLDLIVKGDVAAARNMEDSSWGDNLFADEDVADSDSKCSGGSATSARGVSWSSLQYTEALKILNTVTAVKQKKCDKCGKRNPTISSPTFGWLNKVTRDSDVRANILGENDYKAENSTISQSENDSAVETEEDPQEKVSKVNKKKTEDLVAEYIKQTSKSGQQHMFPTEVEHILKNLWKNEADLCMFMCDIQQRNLSLSERSKGYTMFFLKSLLVPPSKFRPPGNSSRGLTEHPQNTLLRKVQESNIALQKCINDNSSHSDTVRKWMELQRSVNILFDSSKGSGKNEKDTPGIRQLLEKKTGILRQKMMGKRVNFACRSVISPDPYLAVNEIGIPPYFAMRLTYPERVTPWNADRLRHAVVNGADIHPGATHYKDKQRMYKLQASQPVRNAISRKLPAISGVLSHQGKGPETELEGKVVYRHLEDGDIVLVNRQPTLHKPSMMAHVVRVLKGEKTLRMHYANCSTYNADFDGDEMNVHLPQDEISRSEATNIVNADKQYIVPTSGEPIRGLIQDHIISAVLLTKSDTFLTREDYQQLLYASLPPPSCQKRSGIMVSIENSLQPVPPAIWKPIPLWTGKQVLSAILNYVTSDCERFTVEKEVRIPKEYIANNDQKLKLKIRNNELIDGIMDKNQFGKFGLVHVVYELYGPDIAGRLMSILSRLFTSYLQMHGFTCGISDLLLVQNADFERKRILEKSEEQSEDVHVRFCGIKDGNRDPTKLQREIEKALRSNGETGTARLDRMMSNAMNVLTSEVNQALFPKGFVKPFPKNCLSLMTTTGAKGGLVNMTQISSLLGQQELEGKRVPRMASGKTLPCFPSWDFSSRAGGFISDRFLTGLRPQEYYFHCMAGRDGLVDTAIKTSRSGYLQRCIIKSLECVKVSYDLTVRDADGSVVQFAYGEDGVDVMKTSLISQFKILAENDKVVLQQLDNESGHAHWTNPNSYITKLPRILRDRATEFVRSRENQNGPQIRLKNLIKLLTLKYFSSLAEPGESVGVIAAQSVGEPSTQMTLNTFHLAGKGEMNVTLGIPRLQEILMTASQNIRTPVMTCPLIDGKNKEDAERLAASLRRITVVDIVEGMEVRTVPFYVGGNHISTLYKLRMKLYPSELYPPHSAITTEDILNVLRTVYVDAMEDSIAKHLDIIRKISDISSVGHQVESTLDERTEEDERNKSTNAEENADGHDDDDHDGADDHGTDAEKRRKQASDEVEYDDDLDIEGSAVQGQHDIEPESGFESEIDHFAMEEDDDDYLIGGTSSRSDTDNATPESPSKSEVIDDEKKSESVKTGKKKAEPGSNKKPALKRSKKKIRRTVFVEAEELMFEVHYEFRKEPHILLAEIAQKTAKSIYVKSSENIENCSVTEQKNNNNCLELQTAGVNFLAFWLLDEYLDVSRIYSNDIHAMLNTYGVEAARETIIREVNNVFKAYGIQVNIRHLNLIADFMTSTGGYRSMNRMGMSGFSTSPFGKMTFETATKFMVEAAMHGEIDTLESPSARVCLGQPVKVGTGCFDLMQNLSQC